MNATSVAMFESNVEEQIAYDIQDCHLPEDQDLLELLSSDGYTPLLFETV